MKVEFYIQIYFTIHPVHPNTTGSRSKKEFSRQRQDFKKFLDSRGQQLSKTNEFLSYYALPYVDNPQSHPSFKQMFSEDWLDTITTSTRDFLQRNIITKGQSKLVQMYNVYKQHVKNKAASSMDQMQQLEDTIEHERQSHQETQDKLNHVKNMLINSQTKWNNFSNKLLKISEDLYYLLEQTGAIENVNEQWLQESTQKLNTYRNFLIKLNQEREQFKN